MLRTAIRMPTALLAALLLLLGAAPGGAQATQPQLEWRHPLPQGNHLNALARGEETYVAVGDYGAVVLSHDGETWQQVAPFTPHDLIAVAFGNGCFVALDEAGEHAYRSTDGQAWETHALPPGSAPFTHLTFGRGQFLALAEDGSAAALSADGAQWEVHPLSPGVQIGALTASDDGFAATGRSEEGEALLLTSSDGRAWSQTRVPGIGRWPAPLPSIAAGNGHIVLAGWGQMATLWGGVGWVQQPVPTPHLDERTSGVLGRLFFDGHRFLLYSVRPFATVAYGLEHVALEARLFTSPDGRTWTPLEEPQLQPPALRAFLPDGDGYLAVGSYGAIASFDPGQGWRYHTHHPDLQAMAYGDGVLVAADASTLYAFSETEGWRPVQAGVGSARRILFTNGRFVAVTIFDGLWVSTDGTRWSRALLPTSPGLHPTAVAAGDGLFLGADSSGTLHRSSDGLTWERLDFTLPADALTYADGRFYASDGQWLYTSADGVAWTKEAIEGVDPQPRPSQMVAGGGRFVALRLYTICNPRYNPDCIVGDLYASEDGLTWRPARRLTSARTLHYAGGWFIAAGRHGRVYRSADGLHWERVPLPTAHHLTALTTVDGDVVAAGDGGALIRLPAFGRPEPACQSGYADLPHDHPGCEAVRRLTAEGLLQGDGDGNFRPESPLNRAEMAALLVRALGLTPMPDQPHPFPDAQDHWAARDGYLQAAVAAGLLRGYADGTFRPDGPVTRAEAIAMATRARRLRTDPDPSRYGDVPGNAWYEPAVREARMATLIGPHAPWVLWDAYHLEPDRPATRAEAALLIANLRTLSAR